MRQVQMETEVGNDGVLDLKVPLGAGEARSRVIVTIQPAPTHAPAPLEKGLGWAEFIGHTYASCAGLGLQRPPQGAFDIREVFE